MEGYEKIKNAQIFVPLVEIEPATSACEAVR